MASAGLSARIDGGTVSMADFTRVLSNMVGRTVIDKTGFTGTFDVHMEFTRDQALAGNLQSDTPLPPDPANVTIFTAVQEQLGLKLDSARGPVDVIVIDSVERPTEN